MGCNKMGKQTAALSVLLTERSARQQALFSYPFYYTTGSEILRLLTTHTYYPNANKADLIEAIDYLLLTKQTYTWAKVNVSLN